MHTIQYFAGLASGILSLIAFLPYIVDTLAGRTKPVRSAWFIWSILGVIAFLSLYHQDASHSLWFVGVQVGGTLVIFALSIRHGVGSFTKRTDRWVLLVAGLGLALWAVTENATYALFLTITVSLVGGIAKVLKAYSMPGSETLSTWVLCLAASICAMIAVGSFDWILLAYPLYLFTLYGAIVVAILLGNRAALQALSPISSESGPV